MPTATETNANSEGVPSGTAHAVAVQLSQAWCALSGEIRSFKFTSESRCSPAHAEFSFVIPMTLDRDGSTFAVTILIGREDATVVASSMFGVDSGDVPEDDIRDACSEVCNIFADCISTHRYAGETVHIGLPFRLDEANYQHVYGASGVSELFQSFSAGHYLSVMLFTPSNPV